MYTHTHLTHTHTSHTHTHTKHSALSSRKLDFSNDSSGLQNSVSDSSGGEGAENGLMVREYLTYVNCNLCIMYTVCVGRVWLVHVYITKF